VGKSSSKISRQKIQPSQPTRLLLIRHAEIEPRYQRKFGGRIDMNLSTRGHEQAKILTDYMRSKEIAAIYSSPMKRVQQTVAPLLENGASAQTVLPEFREVDFGDWTGFSWEEVGEKFGVHPYDWLDEIELGAVSNGENGIQFRARVEPRLFEIIHRHQGKTAAIFCHGGVIRMILAILLDLPLAKTNSFEIEYASITQVVLRPHLNEIELLNFTPWRDRVR
jgi:broad specificity phosphatase PhoE